MNTHTAHASRAQPPANNTTATVNTNGTSPEPLHKSFMQPTTTLFLVHHHHHHHHHQAQRRTLSIGAVHTHRSVHAVTVGRGHVRRGCCPLRVPLARVSEAATCVDHVRKAKGREEMGGEG
jgi:hypothetical protein